MNIKTYKTKKGLDTAVGKLLGFKSVASETGSMTEGWLSVPLISVGGDKEVRYFSIGSDGYPSSLSDTQIKELEETFGGFPDVISLFKRDVSVVDIPLEVSK